MKTNEVLANGIAAGIMQSYGVTTVLPLSNESKHEEVQYISHAYKGNTINFHVKDDVKISATQMAKPFGASKDPKHWLKTLSAMDYISTFSKVRNLTLADLVIVKKGGTNPGTWMHEDVALEFARWLSPEFAIWCNDRIKEILLGRKQHNEEIDNDKLNSLLDNYVHRINNAVEDYNKQLSLKFNLPIVTIGDYRKLSKINRSADVITNINTIMATVQNNMASVLYKAYSLSEQENKDNIATRLITEFLGKVEIELNKYANMKSKRRETEK